jgi:hypothetical protein
MTSTAETINQQVTPVSNAIVITVIVFFKAAIDLHCVPLAGGQRSSVFAMMYSCPVCVPDGAYGGYRTIG